MFQPEKNNNIWIVFSLVSCTRWLRYIHFWPEALFLTLDVYARLIFLVEVVNTRYILSSFCISPMTKGRQSNVESAIALADKFVTN